MKKNRKTTAKPAVERLPPGAKQARAEMLRNLAGRAAALTPAYLRTLPKSTRKFLLGGAK